MALPTPCKEAGCPEVVADGSRCSFHRKVRESRRRQRRGKRPYDTKLWREVVRPEQLTRQPDCEDCGEWASEVDHIDGDATNHAPDNLRSLCKPCHTRRTALEHVHGSGE